MHFPWFYIIYYLFFSYRICFTGSELCSRLSFMHCYTNVEIIFLPSNSNYRGQCKSYFPCLSFPVIGSPCSVNSTLIWTLIWVLSELPGNIEMIVLDVQPAFSINWKKATTKMFNIKTRDVSFCSFCKPNLTRTTMGPAFQLLSRVMCQTQRLWVKQNTGPPLWVSTNEDTRSCSHPSSAVTCVQFCSSMA